MEELIKTDLQGAWKIIARVLEATARAEIETEAVQRAMPKNYTPPFPLFSPDHAVRSAPHEFEEVVSSKPIELWVDAKTGKLFADQSAEPNKPAIRRQFKQVQYLAKRTGDVALPFYHGLVFPRLGPVGQHLFNGSLVRSPQAVLEALSAHHPELKPRPVMTRIEPVSGPNASRS